MQGDPERHQGSPEARTAAARQIFLIKKPTYICESLYLWHSQFLFCGLCMNYSCVIPVIYSSWYIRQGCNEAAVSLILQRLLLGTQSFIICIFWKEKKINSNMSTSNINKIKVIKIFIRKMGKIFRFLITKVCIENEYRLCWCSNFCSELCEMRLFAAPEWYELFECCSITSIASWKCWLMSLSKDT